MSQDITVGITDSDSQRAGRSGDRIPVEAGFSTPVQTSPEAHPFYHIMGTGSFSGVKRPGRGVDHPPSSSTEVEGRVELYIYLTSGPSWPVLGRPLPLPFTLWAAKNMFRCPAWASNFYPPKRLDQMCFL